LDLKGIIAVDSYFGNTLRIAEAFAEQIRSEGHGVKLINLHEKLEIPGEGDFMFIGSPTRFKRMTKKAKKLVKKLDVAVWKGKPIVAFDTVSALPTDPVEREKAKKWTEDGAGPKLQRMIKARGLDAYPEVLRYDVKDMKGPLVDGSIEAAKKQAHDFLASIKR
jgi:flavodoxin